MITYNISRPLTTGSSILDGVVGDIQNRVKSVIDKAAGQASRAASDIGKAAGKSWLKANIGWIILGFVVVIGAFYFLGRKK